MKIWIPIAIVAIFLMAVAGLLPLPGQKDNVTPHNQPAAAVGAPEVKPPVGPPPSPPSDPTQAGIAKQPPPGGAPSPTPGGPTADASNQTMTGDGPKRDAR